MPDGKVLRTVFDGSPIGICGRNMEVCHSLTTCSPSPSALMYATPSAIWTLRALLG
jgi:hypothetical protein